MCAQNSSRLRGVTRPLRIWRMRIANDGHKRLARLSPEAGIADFGGDYRRKLPQAALSLSDAPLAFISADFCIMRRLRPELHDFNICRWRATRQRTRTLCQFDRGVRNCGGFGK